MNNCKQCNQPFTLAPEDKEIMKKLEVSDPQLCSVCSLLRRLAWRNERHLYWRTCELCKKEILAMYAPSSYARVYCRECWFSDLWDPLSYGRSYDESKPFMDQVFGLLRDVPHYNLWKIGNNENAEYANMILSARNCYLGFSCLESDGVVYGKNVDYSRDCVDCYNVFKGELLYECVDVRESYRCAYLTRSTKCNESYLCRDCHDVSNCFGCVNLKHKQYCWFNEQLTKTEYERRLQEALSSRASFEAAHKKFIEFSLTQPVEFAIIRSSEGATGDYVYNCKDTRASFDVYNDDNIGDAFRVYDVKDSCRLSYTKDGQLVYEYISGPNEMQVIACMGAPNLSMSAYCFECYDSDNLLGCMGLRKKKFCILNKEYSEQEYRRLRTQIVEQLRRAGQYGEFFPTAQSFHAYNDSTANESFPLTKEEVLARGWRWNDDQGGSRGKETIKPADVPTTTEGIPESITKEILACVQCGLNYRIQAMELQALRTFGLSLPIQCQECRFKRRLKLHNFPPLYTRGCMCKNAAHSHPFPCPTQFETTYSPDRPEIVYCNPCYQQEIK